MAEDSQNGRPAGPPDVRLVGLTIVVVYRNVVARLRRVPHSFEEASADLGASTRQTFRWETLPSLRSALVAGACLRSRSPSAR